MADVILKNISKTYDGKTYAVSNVNVDIKDKEFVVLVGPSGCGKSTTLRMIAGLEEISGGELLIDGKKMNDISPKDRDIAMVFQNYALYPHMSVYDNMAFGLKMRKYPKKEIEDRVNEAAKILELEPYLSRKPKALSGGQRQRVALGRAIVRKPKVFLFDEPLSNLDAKMRVQTRTEISKLHKRLNATMIYVTHDQTEAMTMGDRIVVMKDGIVNQIDAPLSLYKNPKNKFVAGFIGSPAMNFIDGKVISENDDIFFNSNKSMLKLHITGKRQEKLKTYMDKEISVGIRPEAIREAWNEKEQSDINRITVKIDVVEPMGNEIFLYFQLEGNQFIARIPSGEIPEFGSSITFLFDASSFHFFDKETGNSIG